MKTPTGIRAARLSGDVFAHRGFHALIHIITLVSSLAFASGCCDPNKDSVVSQPILTGPADGIVLANYPRTTTLTWKPVAGAARYRVEVECLHCTTTGDWSALAGTPATITETTYTITMPGDNKGRWRITTIKADGSDGPASNWRQFEFKTAPERLAAPKLTDPADGAVLTRFPRITVLTWQPVSGAVRYRIDVQCLHCKTNGDWSPLPDTPATVDGNSYKFVWPADNKGRWRVTAIAADGSDGLTSNWSQFEYRTAP